MFFSVDLQCDLYYKINSRRDESQRDYHFLLYTFFQIFHSENISFTQLGKKFLENKIKSFFLN